MGKNFKDWCEVTSWHGFVHLQHAKTKCGRVGWTIVLVWACFNLLQQSNSLLAGYFTSDTWATTMNKQFIGGLPSPTITICNYNRVRRSAAAEYNFTEDLITYYFERTALMGQYLIHDETKHTQSNYTAWRMEHNMTYEKILKVMSHQCDDTIVFLKSAYLGYKSVEEVCQRTMENDNVTVREVITSDYGLCYQIEFNPNETISLTGAWGSTTLLLNAQTHEYVEGVTNNYNDEGFALQVSYGGQVLSGTWLTIMPGQHSWIGMKTHAEGLKTRPNEIQKIMGLGPPCSEYAAMPAVPDEHFDKSACYMDCITAPLARECGCYPVIRAKELELCELEVLDGCFDDKRSNQTFMKLYNSELETCMEEYCKLSPCEKATIETSLATSRFPSLNQKQRFKEAMLITGAASDRALEKMERNIALVDIYYTTLDINMMEWYHKTSFAQVVSNIGGQMGLWMGISVITMIHAVMTCCSNCCCRGKQVRPKNKDSYATSDDKEI